MEGNNSDGRRRRKEADSVGRKKKKPKRAKSRDGARNPPGAEGLK